MAGVREEGVLKQDMPFLSKKNSEGHLVPAHVDNQPPLLADEDPTSSNDSDPWKMGPSPFLWPLWFGHSGHLLALVSTTAPSLVSVAQLSLSLPVMLLLTVWTSPPFAMSSDGLLCLSATLVWCLGWQSEATEILTSTLVVGRLRLTLSPHSLTHGQ